MYFLLGVSLTEHMYPMKLMPSTFLVSASCYPPAGSVNRVLSRSGGFCHFFIRDQVYAREPMDRHA